MCQFLVWLSLAIRVWLIVDENPKARGGANSAAISLEVPNPAIVKFRRTPAVAEFDVATGVGSRSVRASNGLGRRNNAARPLIIRSGSGQALW